jgi:2-iminobutanoate/2-iminopropanoate deaminase
MEKTPIFGSSAPVSGAPYTPAVQVGNFLFISGQLGLDPETKQPFIEFSAQVNGAIAGLSALLAAAGGSLENIVKTTVFLSGDMSRFAEFNAIYAAHFDFAVRPARSTFAVAALPLGALIEIEAIAAL